MEAILGKQNRRLDSGELHSLLQNYQSVSVDIGTGDGRYVIHTAKNNSQIFTIGIDACRENLRQLSRKAPSNALFLVANALLLPGDLAGVANLITVNFPWGSLLEGLINGERGIIDNMMMLSCQHTNISVCLNGSSIENIGRSVPQAESAIQRALEENGFRLNFREDLDADRLRQIPSTWAQRMASGRRPEGIHLSFQRE